jgi:riboflavin-specific deaminase-like protein
MIPPTRKGRLSSGLPFLLVNMAMTADGKTATPNRRVSSFGSRYDQVNMLRLRATGDAVMAGARTADLNPVHLGPGSAKYRRLRRRHRLAAYNLRVIVSGGGTLNPRAEVFAHKFSPLIILTTRRASAAALRRLRQVATEVKVCGEREIDFRRALRWLRKQWGINRLVCEGGGELNDALFRARVVNELHLTVCPKLFGGRTAPTISDGAGVARLTKAARLEFRSTRRRGNELFLIYRIHRPRA